MKKIKNIISRISPGDWIVWFSVVVLLGTWLISLRIVINDKDLEISRAKRETENLSIILERHIHETFARIEASLFTMREQWENGAGRKEMTEFLNNKVTANPALFNLISVIDKNGNVIVTDKKEFKPTYSGDRPFFIHHKDNNSPYLHIGNPIIGRVTGKWYIPVSLLLRNKGGNFDGVVLASVNPYYFSMIFQEVKLGKKSLVYLADYKGIIFSGMLGNEDMGLDKIISPHIVSGFTDTGESPPEIVSTCLDGVERIFSRKFVKDRTMFVSVGVSLDELLEQWETRTIFLMTAQFIISSIILLFMFRLRQAIISRDEVTAELDRFFSTSLDLLCIADLQGNFRRVNKEWENILGYSSDYLEGKSFLEFIHPDDIQGTLDAMTSLSTGNDVLNFSNRYRCLDGSYRYIEWRSTPHENLIYASARDMTDRKLAGETLRESEARYRSIIENSPVGYYIYSLDKDEQLILKMFNPAADKIIRVSHEQFIGRYILDIFPALAGTGVPEMYKAVAKGEMEAQNFEVPYDYGGIKGVYEVRVFQGEPGQVVVNFADISGRNRLEMMNKTFENIIKRSRDFIGIANPGKDAFFVNPAGQAMVGLDSDDEVSKTVIEDYFLEEDLTFVKETILPDLFSKGRWVGEFRFRHFKTGEAIPVLYDLFLTEDPETGELTNITTISRDISERKLAEEKQLKLTEQLHQSQKMDAVGQLAGGIAHDFNNLIAGIIGFAELLLVKEKISENQQKYISNIITSANRAGNLTKKLLTFSHRGIKASTDVDCAKIISDTIEMLRRTIDKIIDISFNNKAEETSIIGDDSMLQNVFLNISINAAHAMPHGGKLIFAIKNINLDRDYCDFSPFDILPGEFLEITIRDTGTGMPREIMSRIFDPFFTTKEPGKGTGLGLSMVYAAIQEHSGAINVYSEVGTGTEFHIYLPISKKAQNAEISSGSLTQGSATILLIDDEELIRISAAALLKSMGYTVMQAENGKHGIEVFEEHHREIDLIILDMIMPVMGGRDSFRKFREINPHIPILIASGFAREEDMTLLKEQGISGFLQKPFRSAELSDKVSDIINNTARENHQ